MNLNTAVICDYPVSTLSFDENYEAVVRNLKEKKGQWVVTLNLEMIYHSCRDERYKNLLKQADFFVADGVPLIWASKLKEGEPEIKNRSNGTDLTERLLKSLSDVRIGVIGGEDPGLAIQRCNPRLLTQAYIYDDKVDVSSKKAVDEIISQLKEHQTELLFLNLGTPKQDLLAGIIRKRNNAITVIGIGGSFDILAGLKPRAPKWMQKNGLEWLFRLGVEPKRLARRYLINYPQALYFLLRDIFINR